MGFRATRGGQLLCCAQSGSGFGSKASTRNGSGKGKGKPKDDTEVIAEARKTQTYATDLFATLLQATDKEDTAAKMADMLDEQFFMIANTYLAMAKKEGNMEVTKNLETTLKIAMNARNNVLRPEIRLLNNLLNSENELARRKLLETETGALTSDNEYFFTLLKQMNNDVKGKEDKGSKRLVELLGWIETEATKEKLKLQQ